MTHYLLSIYQPEGPPPPQFLEPIMADMAALAEEMKAAGAWVFNGGLHWSGVAVQRWPAGGVPPSPAGWIITTARNRAIDRLRREASREDRHAQPRCCTPRTRAVTRPRRDPCATNGSG